MVCVPLILFSFFAVVCKPPSPGNPVNSQSPFLTHSQLTNFGPFFTLPSWLQVPYLEPNLGAFAAMTWGGLYLLLEPVAGGALALICLAAAAATNYLRLQDSTSTNQIAIAVHVVCWIAQFVGHGAFEGRAPALLDNLFQAIFLAPLFVWLELLFIVGYRPELKKRVDKAVVAEIAKFRESKAKKAQ